MALVAEDVIQLLKLQPHPEGGYYRETFRDPAVYQGRSCSTAIYFLLREGVRSHWHRIDVAEVWHWYAGGPLELFVSPGISRVHLLGPDLVAGERPQFVVPAHVWQSARTLGAWTLVGCTVAPGFEFQKFEIAPPGWSPPLEEHGGG